MSRKEDEKELRKLDYLEARGVATFDDRLRRRDLARKMVLEDFEESEDSEERVADELRKSMMEKWVQRQGDLPSEKKGVSN